MSRKRALCVLAGTLIVSSIGISTVSAAQVSLLLPQSNAFAILGHSCGGIQEKAYAAGFDSVSGYPIGEVYIQTRCGGSGRGGGYRTTTYSAWVGVMWDFAGNVLDATKLKTVPPVDGSLLATDAYGDQVYNTGTAAFLIVPAPSSATDVTAAQSGDQFQVAWTPNGVNPLAVTSSTLTATPVDSTASIVTTTVGGSAPDGLLGPLEPDTTYQVTVENTTIGGSSPASDPITVTTVAASTAPSAPTGVAARWTAVGATTATLVATWHAAVPGDSPINQYEVTIKGSDGGGAFTHDVSGTTLTASFVVDFIPDWSVTVRAHNAVGWGPWSPRFTLGGL